MTTSRSGLNAGDLDAMVTRHAATLETLRGATLLVTGATGWLGVWLLEALCAADQTLGLGLSITGVSREPRRFLQRFPAFVAEPRIKWIKADVRNLALGGQYSHVIHGASDQSAAAGAAAARTLFDTIVDGTRRVLDASTPKCKSLLLVSSGAIYGPARDGRERFVEADATGPDPSRIGSVYAEGKRAAEQLCAIAAVAGVPARIARCFASLGPHMPFDRQATVGNFIADAAAGRPITVSDGGTRSYVYMTDLVAALLTILAKGAVGRAYNVGSDAGNSVADLAHAVNRVVNGGGVVVHPEPSEPGERYVPDTTRLREELGFTPEVALDDAISRTAAWYRERAPAGVAA